jgi:RND family efflux transporter MFP subunit
MEVEAGVPASDIPSIRVGQEVNFRVEGYGEREFRGRIDRINPATQSGSRSILVYAVLPNQDGSLKGGMFAKGSVTLTRIESAQVLPASAVRAENGKAFVMRITGDRLESREVKLGLVNEDEGVVQIVDGLDAQSRVIRSNLGNFKPGAIVKVAPSRN